jgi:hypothetical protein
VVLHEIAGGNAHDEALAAIGVSDSSELVDHLTAIPAAVKEGDRLQTEQGCPFHGLIPGQALVPFRPNVEDLEVSIEFGIGN